MNLVKYCEPSVEIIANERKPKLTGGRRGAATLQPGGTNVNTPLVPVASLPATAGRRCGGALLPGTNAVNRSLVPVSQIPPSGGYLSLASVMDILNKRLNKKKGGAIDNNQVQSIKQRVLAMKQQKGGKRTKTGGKSLSRMLADPEKNLPGLVEAVNESPPAPNPDFEGSGRKRRGRPKKGGAMVVNPDGTTSGIASDDPMTWRRIGGAYLGPDGKIHSTKGLIGKTKGGKMSKLVPRHGHGANTSIGTNYQLGQFGGAIQPIGNTASTLSPVLSKMSVGAGRRTLPKDKKVKEILHLMVKGRRLLKGKGLLGDAWDALKKVATDLYNKYGPKIFEDDKLKLIDFLKEEAEKYILGHHYNGGGFFGLGALQLSVGLISMGKYIFKEIVSLLGEEIVKNLQKEVIRLGVDLAKRKGEQLLGLTEVNGKLEKKEGAGISGGKRHRKIKHPIIGGDPSTWTPKTGGKSSVTIQNLLEEMSFPQNRQRYVFFQAAAGQFGVGGLSSNEYDYAGKCSLLKGYFGQQFPSKEKYFNDNTNLCDYYLESTFDEMNEDFIQACADRDEISYDEEYKKIWETNPPNYTGKGSKTGGRKQSPSSSGKSKRGEIVKKIMKEKKLSLPMASKYVKEHGLY